MNLLEIRAVLSKDPILFALIEQIDLEFPLINDQDIYLSLIRSITGQQLSVKAAKTIYERFLTLFENNYPSKEQLISLDIEILRSKGLSRQKAGYIQNIAKYFSQPKVKEINWDELSDEEIIRELVSIKGVGRWTVEMMLMFTLNRSDVFPDGDLAIQKGMKQLYQIESSNKKELLAKMNGIAEHWKPYRTYACKYIWAGKDLYLK